jgi:hypothetical protein
MLVTMTIDNRKVAGWQWRRPARKVFAVCYEVNKQRDERRRKERHSPLDLTHSLTRTTPPHIRPQAALHALRRAVYYSMHREDMSRR